MRNALRAAAAIAVLAGTLTLVSPSAGATIYNGSGVWGYNAPSEVSCRFMNAWGVLRVEVPPPTAYAFNRFAGAGNDWQLVRYRLTYLDARTGAVLASSGWSGFAWAGDNTPARWNGISMQNFAPTAHVRVDTTIEFYNRNGAYEGFTAHRADRYFFYNGNVTHGQGPLSNCATLNWRLDGRLW